jgi:hypothetical protein
MLHLIYSNKAGRNFNSDPEVNWKALFKASEDSFTSSIFGLLLYLPAEQFWDIIKNAAQIKPDIGFPGQVFGYEFWPSWKTKTGDRCEPDIYIEFENLNLIVEAKRYDGEQQLEYQWQTELEAYHESIESDKPVCLLAAGGIRNGSLTSITTRDQSKTCPVIQCRWSHLLNQISSMKNHLAKAPENTINGYTQLNILKDLVISFEIHGFQTGKLFNTMPTNINLSAQGEHTLLRFVTPARLHQIPNYTININNTQTLSQWQIPTPKN